MKHLLPALVLGSLCLVGCNKAMEDTKAMVDLTKERTTQVVDGAKETYEDTKNRVENVQKGIQQLQSGATLIKNAVR